MKISVNYVSPKETLSVIQSSQRIFIHGSAHTPTYLLEHPGYADYVPVFLSEIPELFKQNILPIDVAIVQVSPPDSHGYCSLGVSVDIARSAVNTARYVIAQVNPNAPRTHGHGLVHYSRFQAMVYCEEPLHTANFNPLTSNIVERIY